MKKEIQLTDAQLEIMQIIWSHNGAIMFSELAAELEQKQKSWKTNTILTFLARLVERGMLRIEKQGRLNRYVALMSEPDYLEQQAKCFVDKVFGGDAKHLVSALFRQECLSEDDYEELKDFWNEESGKG